MTKNQKEIIKPLLSQSYPLTVTQEQMEILYSELYKIFQLINERTENDKMSLNDKEYSIFTEIMTPFYHYVCWNPKCSRPNCVEFRHQIDNGIYGDYYRQGLDSIREQSQG